jgi:type III secretion system FlhB-like substrate exporter
VVVRKFVAALAVSAALVLGTTGCSLTHNVPTLQAYSPSDGTDVTVDGVKGLNLIYLTERNTAATTNEVGAIIGSFVNTTDAPVQLRLQFNEDGSSAPDVVTSQKREWISETIAPGAKYDLGYNENPALAAIVLQNDGTNAAPGSLVSVWLAVNNGAGVEVRLPALDGSLEQYSALVQNLGNAVQ